MGWALVNMSTSNQRVVLGLVAQWKSAAFAMYAVRRAPRIRKPTQVFRTKQAEALGSNPSESITNFLIKSLINPFKGCGAPDENIVREGQMADQMILLRYIRIIGHFLLNEATYKFATQTLTEFSEVKYGKYAIQ